MEKNPVLELVSFVNKKIKQGEAVTADAVRPFLNEKMNIRVISAGTYFVTEGQPITKILYIAEGSFYLMRNSDGGKINLAARKRAPQFIGLRGINDPREIFFASYYAVEPCIAVEFEKDFFWKSVQSSGELGMEVIKNLEASLFSAASRSNDMLFCTAKEKLMLYILKYKDEFCTEKGKCEIAVKNIFIADAIGVNIRTLYRTVDELKREGLVTIKKGNLNVTDEQVAVLRQICGSIIGDRS